MRQYLIDLYEIQKIDLGLREQEQRRDIIPLALNKLISTATDLQRQTSSLADQSSLALKEAKGLQALVEAEKDKIRKWEARLNDIRNQREYQALQRETEGSKRANRDSEEKISGLHARKETLERDLVTAREKLAQVEAERETEQAKVDTEIAAITKRIDAEQARRDALVPNIPKSLYRTYDSIRSRRMGVGLSLVSQGCCTSCNIRLPPQLYNILQRCETIEQCPSCRRVMCWERLIETPEAAETTSAESAQESA